MSNSDNNFLKELGRIRHVSDMMATSHTALKEKYFLLSLFSDMALFSCSLFLTVIAFANVNLLNKYFGINYVFWVGAFSVTTFIYSFLVRLLDWKIRAESHRYAVKTYMTLKFKARDIINKIKKHENVDVERFIDNYNTLTPTIIPVPENDFLKYKRKHKIKVSISQHLDTNPAASILLLRIKMWFSDNFRTINK
jgi:hypothetical protein